MKTDHSYEASKYEIDLIASNLAEKTETQDVVRHFVVHPGIAHTNMTAGMINWFLDMCKLFLFYVVSLPLESRGVQFLIMV